MNKNPTATLKEALQKFVEAYLQGRRPNIDEFVKQYPQHESQLKQRIQDLREIDTLFDSIFKIEGSEFEDEMDPHNLVGRKVRNFEIVKLIGRGGMGVVYQAHDTKLDRLVAIKSMPACLLANSTEQARFRHEAKLLASLNHPNIAAIYDIIEHDDGLVYLVLEYVPGQSLAEIIARKTLGLGEVISIARQVAEAVSAAHAKGIVHRDLKPGNIKITPEGRVEVLDFGLAEVLITGDNSGNVTNAKSGRIIGTPAYMSPEQASGEAVDQGTDTWSFGCIIYEMLTGQLPFGGDTATDMLAHIIDSQPDWKCLPQEIPAYIRTLLRRCLEKNPKNRPGDMEIAEMVNTPVPAKLTVSARLRKAVMIVGVAIIVVLFGVTLRLLQEKQISSSLKKIRLVVLPFENLGPSEDEYFADGITNEVTARLTGIRGLGVISRQSAAQYKNERKSTKQIAEELGVDYILEGTIQRGQPSDPNNRVRIIPQLINTSNDTRVWTEIYDDEISDVFRLQSCLAEQVAQALDITLHEQERRRLVSVPTENRDAYEYYLQGNKYYYGDKFKSSIETAIAMYETAIKLDSRFALAYAQLSMAHMRMYWYRHDHSETRLNKAKDAALTALNIDPDLPEAHLALGRYYYQGHLNYDRAVDYLKTAQKGQPGNSDILLHIGAIQRRQGKFEKALSNLKKASELNFYSDALEVGTTLVLMRKYAEADKLYARYISLTPDLPMAYDHRARLYLLWKGDTKTARKVLEEALLNVTSKEEEPDPAPRDVLFFNIDCLEGHYDEALDRLPLKSGNVNDINADDALRYAIVYGFMNKKELEREYCEHARDILVRRIHEDPNNPWLHISLGIAYAGLGRKADAIGEGETAVELLPVSTDALRGPRLVEDLARIYVMVGEHDAAIDRIEDLLDRPSEMSVQILRLDPTWKPLRNHPRFKKLVAAGE